MLLTARFTSQPPPPWKILSPGVSKCIRVFFSACLKPRFSYGERHLPYSYHNYKAKCLSDTGGLSCTKDHVHEREVVSDYHHPLKKNMRSAARAVRLVKKLLNDPSWTLWQPAEVATTFHQKYELCQTKE